MPASIPPFYWVLRTLVLYHHIIIQESNHNLKTKIKDLFPSAIYLDTNVLRKSGWFLTGHTITELRYISQANSIPIYLPELVLREWCKLYRDEIEKELNLVKSKMSFLVDSGVIHDATKILELSTPHNEQIFDDLSRRLSDSSIIVIPNSLSSIETLIEEAILHRPPFQGEDKGFRDAIIVDSCANHAKQVHKDSFVVLISNDKAVQQSVDRFTSRNLKVVVLDPEDAPTKVNSLLSDASIKRFDRKQIALLTFVEQHRELIFDFINESEIKIGNSIFDVLGIQDEREPIGTIKSVVAIQPTKFKMVLPGILSPNSEEVDKTRYPLTIVVDIDVTVEMLVMNIPLFTYEAIITPNALAGSTPVEVSNGPGLYAQKIEQHTLHRQVMVEASVDSFGVEREIYSDIQLHRVY